MEHDGMGMAETLEQKVERYERTLRAIAESPLTGTEFGDWVQGAAEDALDGLEAECPGCGSAVHAGKCVDQGDDGEDDADVDEDDRGGAA